MYYVFLTIYLIIIAGITLGSSILKVTIEPVVLVSMLLIIASLFIASGFSKDFIKIMKFLRSSKVEFKRNELSRMLEAVKLLNKLSIVSSIFISMAGLLALLTHLDDPSVLGPYIALMIIPIFYTLIIVSILLPVESKIKVKLMED